MSFDFDEEQPRNGAILESTSEDGPSDEEERGDDEDLEDDGEEEDAEGLEEDDEEELGEDEEEESEIHDQSGFLQGGDEVEEGNELQQMPLSQDDQTKNALNYLGLNSIDDLFSKDEEELNKHIQTEKKIYNYFGLE